MENYYTENGSVIVKADSSIYGKDTVLSAGYSILGKAHVMVGKDKETGDFLTRLTPLEGKNTANILKGLAAEFNDQLINYAAFYQESAKNDELRKVLIATALYGARKK